MGHYNPFRPGTMAGPGLFAGRGKALIALETALTQTKNGNPCHFAVVGERGIGKSSLFWFLQIIATGQMPDFDDGKFSFVVVPLALSEGYLESDIVCALGSELQRQIKKEFTVATVAKATLNFLAKFEAFGVAFREGEKIEARPFELIEDLAAGIAGSSAQLRAAGRDGIVFLIDEADKPEASAHLGRTLKKLTETLVRNDCHNVVFGLAGLPPLFDRLRDSHESSPRIFTPIELVELEKDDQLTVIQKGLTIANSKNRRKVTIAPDAADAIATHAEGYPHFLQQVAYSAFEVNRDEEISVQEVEYGTFRDGGAIDCLGVRYFRDMFWNEINSDDYRKVLHEMAKNGKNWIHKRTLREKLKLKETTLNNALNTLKDRKLIVAKPGAMGTYRLPTHAFAKWIQRQTDDRQSGQTV